MSVPADNAYDDVVVEVVDEGTGVPARPPRRRRRYFLVAFVAVLVCGGIWMWLGSRSGFVELAEFHHAGYKNVFYLPAGDQFAVLRGVKLNFWDIRLEEKVDTVGRAVDAAVLASDGKTLVVTEQFGIVDTYDISDKPRQLRRYTSPYARQLRHVAISDNGRWIAASAQTVSIWNAETGEHHAIDAFDGADGALIFLPDSRTLVTVDRGHTLRFWNVESGTLIRAVEVKFYVDDEYNFGHIHPESPYATLSISPDKQYLLCATFLWRIDPWEQVRWQGTRDPIWAPSSVFLPDGKRILTGHYDGTIRLWDLATGQEICRTYAFRNETPVYSVAISPDGKTALSAGPGGIDSWHDMRWPSRDPYVRLWRLPR